MSKLVYLGLLPSFTIDPPVYFHVVNRPFNGLAWNLAGFIGGNTLIGYNTFLFSCVLASSVLVYLIINGISPQHRFLAMAAAALKLAWSANHQIFDVGGLTICFAETTFWAATWLYVILSKIDYQHLSWQTAWRYLLMTAFLLIALGSYEPIWFVLFLVPIIFLLIPGLDFRPYRISTLMWYFISFTYLTFYLFHALVILDENQLGHMTHLLTLGQSIPECISGIKGATIDTFSALIMVAKHTKFLNLDWSLYLVFVLFIAIYVWTGGLLSENNNTRRLATRLMVLGVITVVVGIIPSSATVGVVYGTRYMQFVSYGTIIFIIAFAMWISSRLGRIGPLCGMLILALIFITSAIKLKSVGDYWKVNNKPLIVFWQELTFATASIDEDTIIIVEDAPRYVTSETYATYVLRNLTDRKRVYCFLNYYKEKKVFEYLKNENAVKFETSIAYPFDLQLRDANDGRFGAPLAWGDNKNRVVKIDAGKVLFLKWNIDMFSMEIDKSKSALGRIERKLNPYQANMLMMNDNDLIKRVKNINLGRNVSFFSSASPETASGLKTFPGDTALGYFKNNLSSGSVKPDGQISGLGLQDSLLTVITPKNEKQVKYVVDMELSGGSSDGSLKIFLDGKQIDDIDLHQINKQKPLKWETQVTARRSQFAFYWSGEKQEGLPWVYVANPRIQIVQ